VTIPGAVLLGPALSHLSWAEAIGAFIATGILMLALGLSGWVRRAMEAVPMPIVMGMVAGVFLRFGLDMIFALRDDAWIAAPMVVAFFALGAFPRIARVAPPLIGALAVGVVTIWALGRFEAGPDVMAVVRPNFYAPAFSWRAMVELRGAARDHRAGGAERAGDHGTALRGPFAADRRDHHRVRSGQRRHRLRRLGSHLPHRSGERDHLVLGGQAQTLHCRDLRRPARGRLRAVRARVHAPDARHAQGLHRRARGSGNAARAPERVHGELQDRFALGALVTFLVTVADIPILNIGAPFWGLVFGYAASRLLEREDFAVRH